MATAAPYTAYTPTIANPYPDVWRKVSALEFETPLYLLRAPQALPLPGGREAQYLTAADYVVSFRIDQERVRRRLVVPAGMLTDLASVPRLARWVVGRVGPHLEAAIVHDFLFIAWQEIGRGPQKRDFEFATAVMDAAMRAGGVGGLMRRAIRLAVASPIARRTYEGVNPPPRFLHVPEAGDFTRSRDPQPSPAALARTHAA
ncbi:MAG: DUF1353 domain-containing protein [Pseudomonadota bacterium]